MFAAADKSSAVREGGNTLVKQMVEVRAPVHVTMEICPPDISSVHVHGPNMTKLALCSAQAHGGAAVLKAAQSLGGGQKAPAVQLLAKHDVQPSSGAAALVLAAPASPGKRDAAAACCVMAAAVSCVVAETSMLLYWRAYAEMAGICRSGTSCMCSCRQDHIRSSSPRIAAGPPTAAGHCLPKCSGALGMAVACTV